ncbi:MAG: sigma-54 dependent transcriptional regulator [Nitrospiraceae bacterium]|nr:sigma-54 dependent transcriptional regulator [Nitrospiraceae bacterium]
MAKILIVDDEQSMREMLSLLLRKEGYAVAVAANGEAAISAIQNEIYDLVITDIKMPRVGGIALLKTVKEISPDTIVIVITAYATTETAVDAMKLGAYDYITKPFKNEEIRLIVQKALEKQILRKENILLRREIESRAGFENFIGKSSVMQRIFDTIRQVADSKSTVLITGESGTGKELVARAIHDQSSPKQKPFVAINCGALPETLLESELFGYMKGAFTGATANKQGLFEAANGGTIFLDEISATSPALQIKLLRVIQERSFKRVGGTVDITVDVRVIAASNRNLLADVANGLFREDLYYRLNVIPINIPPLRDRKEDIPLLLEHFLKKNAGRSAVKKISSDALEMLMRHRWPGNVRELENAVERMVIMTTGDLITTEQIPDSVRQVGQCPDLLPLDIPEDGIDLECLLQNAEKTILHKALSRTNGNKTEAAKLLGLSFRSFRHRLHKYE